MKSPVLTSAELTAKTGQNIKNLYLKALEKYQVNGQLPDEDLRGGGNVER